jgi:hypothetical protein
MTDGLEGLLLWMFILVAAVVALVVVSWLLKAELSNLRGRRRRLQDLETELSRTTTRFGFEAGPSGLPNVVGGVATSDDPTDMLRAPISHRPCLAYLVAIGYPLDGDCVAYDPELSIGASRPFILNGGTLVTLDPKFRFSPVAALHRLDFEYTDACRRRGTSDRDLAWMMYVSWQRTKASPSARVYEWILPPDEHCEIEGKSEVTAAKFRTAGETQVGSARLYVGVRENDEGVLDRIQHARIAANQRSCSSPRGDGSSCPSA